LRTIGEAATVVLGTKGRAGDGADFDVEVARRMGGGGTSVEVFRVVVAELPTGVFVGPSFNFF